MPIANNGMKAKDLSTAMDLISKYYDEVLELWNLYGEKNNGKNS